MSEETSAWLAIAVYLIAVLALGYSGLSRSRTLPGYLLADRQLRGGQAGLSAGAADASWWLVLTLPAAAYATGVQAAWIPVGLVLGAWFAWTFVAPRLRSYSRVAGESITVPTFLARRTRDTSGLLRIVTAVLILLLLAFYLAAGLRIGGAFFAATYGTGDLLGLVVVAAVTTAAVLFGGLRGVANLHVLLAVGLTVALVGVGLRGVDELGGWDATVDLARAAGLESTSLLAGGLGAGGLTALAWAVAYLGQPQVLVRMMALRTPRAARAARRVLLPWLVVTLGGAMLVGLATLAYFEQSWRPLNRPEDGLPRLADLLFSPLVGGLLVTAVLAAIMSTVASQLLLCSSALVEDLYRLIVRSPAPRRRHAALARLAVLLVAAGSGWLAYRPQATTIDLVTLAWVGFGITFGPLVLLALFWSRLTSRGALAGLASGVVMLLFWALHDMDQAVRELLPAFAVTVAVAVLVSRRTRAPGVEVAAEFAEMTSRLPRAGLVTRAGVRLVALLSSALGAIAVEAFPAPSPEAEAPAGRTGAREATDGGDRRHARV